MHMYTLPIPHPITLPVPVPIPMFLPVAHNNADRLLETIKEIRDRIPSDPLEAELLMLADALAVDNAGSKSSQASEQGEAASTDLSALEALGMYHPSYIIQMLLPATLCSRGTCVFVARHMIGSRPIKLLDQSNFTVTEVQQSRMYQPS